MTVEQYIEELRLKANSNDYFDLIKEGVKDNINDELTAMSLYFILAEKLKDFGVKDAYNELDEHIIQEVTEHYKELIEFASKHEFLNEILPELTQDINCVKLNDNKEIIINVFRI